MALGKTGDGGAVLVAQNQALLISMTTLLVTFFVSILGRGFLRLVPIFCGILAGVVLNLILPARKG